MTAQDLKNSILQLAMQGKLVPQDPNEEPARGLLDRMKAEQNRLVKEGKIKKKRPLTPVFEDEVPYKIPESWQWVRLHQIGEIVGGGTPKTNDQKCWNNGNIPWITPADMREKTVGKYISRGSRDITIDGLQKSSAQLLPENSLVFSSRAPIGYIAIAKNPISTNQGFKSVVPYVFDVVDFLYYCIQARLRDIEERASGTTFKEISGANFGLTIIPIPPIEEQKRIVEKIEELLPLVERYGESEKRLLELNKKFPDDLRKAILQQAVQGKLTEQDPNDEPASELIKRIKAEKDQLIKEGKIKKTQPRGPVTDDEKLFEIPDNWEWCRVADIILENIGGGTPAKKIPEYWNGDIPWASVKDLPMDDIWLNRTQDTITQSGLDNSSSNCIPKDNIIICTRMGLGKIVINTMDVAINQDLRGLIVSQNMYQLFILQFFKSCRIVGKGQTVKGITIDILENLPFPLPPIEEQKRVVDIIQALFDVSEKL